MLEELPLEIGNLCSLTFLSLTDNEVRHILCPLSQATHIHSYTCTRAHTHLLTLASVVGHAGFSGEFETAGAAQGRRQPPLSSAQNRGGGGGGVQSCCEKSAGEERACEQLMREREEAV